MAKKDSTIEAGPGLTERDRKKRKRAKGIEQKINSKQKRDQLLEGMESKKAGLIYDAEPRKTSTVRPGAEIQATQETAIGGNKNTETAKSANDQLVEKLKDFFELEGEELIRKILEEKKDPLAEKNAGIIWKRLGWQKAGKDMLDKIAAKLTEELGEDFLGGLMESGEFAELMRDNRTAQIINEGISQAALENQQKILNRMKSASAKAALENEPNSATEREKAMESRLKDLVSEQIKGIVKKITEMRDVLEKRGIDLGTLDKEIDAINSPEGKGRIVQHCLLQLEPEKIKEGIEGQENNLMIWAEYFTKGTFKEMGGPEVRAAYDAAFPQTVGQIPSSPETDAANRTPARQITEHAIYSAQTPNVEEMLGKGLSKEDSEKLLKDNMLKLMNDFTTHGILGPPDPRTGERLILPKSDLDGEACRIFLKIAGFDVSKIKYIKQGEEPESGWAFDTTKEHGYVLKDGGKILITNDADKTSRKASSAKFIYETLRDMGFFSNLNEDEMHALGEFEEFVTKEDNKDFNKIQEHQIIENYDRNLMGWRRFLSAEELFRAFLDHVKKGKKGYVKFNPYRNLTGNYFEKLINDDERYGRARKTLSDSKKYSQEALEGMLNNGFVINSGEDRFGEILIDTCRVDDRGISRRKLGLGIDFARYKGYGAYIVISPDGKFLSVQTKKKMKFQFNEGITVSDRYWFYANDEKKSAVTLEEILSNLMGDQNFKIPDELNKTINAENMEKREAQKRYEMLCERLNIDEIERGIPPDLTVFPPEEKEKIMNKIALLEECRISLRRVSRGFDTEDIEFLLSELLSGDYLEAYNADRKEAPNVVEARKVDMEYSEAIRAYFKKNRYNEDQTKKMIRLLS